MAATAAPFAQGVIRTFSELRHSAQLAGPKRVAVVKADDDVALAAAADALRLAMAQPVLVGDEAKIRSKALALGLEELLARAEIVAAQENAAAVAVAMARGGEVDILMKGHLRTDELLHPVLDKVNGLRTGRVLSDMLFFEDRHAGEVRMVGLTDGGINIAPTLAQKKQIVENAIQALRCLGVERPKIAIMSAIEVVTEAMPSTLDARALTEMCAAGEFGEADVYGPLALDNAMLEWAAKAKGINSPVAGHADCMVMPTIEACNLLGKSVMFLLGAEVAHVVMGARVPILIPSRVETEQDKLNAIAMGVVFARR